jgi:GABA(A) receptor-associated protein
MNFSFRDRYTFEKRVTECDRLLKKNPNHIPLVAEKFSGDKYLPSFNKTKYLLKPNTTIGQLAFMIRTSIYLKPSMALFLFINNSIPPINLELGDIYQQYKDPDGFLYIVVTSEATFGSE